MAASYDMSDSGAHPASEPDSESLAVESPSTSRTSYTLAVHDATTPPASRPNSIASLIERKPRGKPISSSNCCCKCIYNIPEGTLMLLLPGLSLLLTGALLCGIWGVGRIGLISLCLGAGVTVAGVIYWIVVWAKYKPEELMKKKARPVKMPGTFMISDGHARGTTQAYDNPTFQQEDNKQVPA